MEYSPLNEILSLYFHHPRRSSRSARSQTLKIIVSVTPCEFAYRFDHVRVWCPGRISEYPNTSNIPAVIPSPFVPIDLLEDKLISRAQRKRERREKEKVAEPRG